MLAELAAKVESPAPASPSSSDTSSDSESDSSDSSLSDSPEPPDLQEYKNFKVCHSQSAEAYSTESNVRPDLKRKHPGDQTSTGTLKLVFKRRTTDNFVVNRCVDNPNHVPKDMKPVVNLEKSDSEYEFDNRNDVIQNKSVLVRRRTLSISRQTSRSEYSVNSSRNDSKMSSECDEELNESCDESVQPHVENEEFSYENHHAKNNLRSESSYNSNRTETRDHISASLNSTSDCHSAESARFRAQLNRIYSNVTSISDASQDSRPRKVTRDLSEASDDVFSPDLTYPLTSSHSLVQDDIESNPNRVSHPVSINMKKNIPSPSEAAQFASPPSPFRRPSNDEFTESRQFLTSSLPFEKIPNEELSTSSRVPVEVVRTPKVLQSTKALHTTHMFSSSKSLADTDDMFNFSDDEDQPSAGFATSFDNRDRQSSMINASVRSAIDSVLNTEDTNDTHHIDWRPRL